MNTKRKAFRGFALLLAVLLAAVPVLTACGPEQTESEDVSETSRETSGSMDPELVANEVSVGSPYTVNVEAIEASPDLNGCELTDGLLAPDYPEIDQGRLVGYPLNNEDGLVITVDLGKVYSNAHRFVFEYLCTEKNGGTIPSLVHLQISKNGKEWVDLGEMQLQKAIEGKMQAAVIDLPEYVPCSYATFTVPKADGVLYLDEITVIADVKSGSEIRSWAKILDAAYACDAKSDADKANELKVLATGTPDRTMDKVNVAEGKKYTLSREPIKIYPDDKKKLTDGSTSTAMDKEFYVGFAGGEEVTVELDLGAEADNIAGFSLHMFANRNLKVSYSPCISVSVSGDGKSWVEVGRMYAPLAISQMTATYELELPQTIRMRYVRYHLSETDTKYFLIDECAVWVYGEGEGNSFYPKVRFPKVTENEFWASTEADYATEQNLILGMTQQVATFGNTEVADDGNNTPVSSGLMTDGSTTTVTNIHSGAFFKFNGGAGREVYYDLTKVCTLKSFNAGFTLQSDWGVHCPETVDIVVSTDAKNWYKAAEMKLDTSHDPSVVRGSVTLKTPIAARFVCFAFPVSSWAGIDELEVHGTKKVDSSVKLADDAGLERYSFQGNPDATADWAGPSDDILGGVHDIILAYHNEAHPRKVDDLLCEAAYLDKDGNILDTMFDGFLFLMSGGFPSKAGGTGGSMEYKKSDMDWLLETLFNEGENILALEETVGIVKKALNLPDDYKVKYYVSLYYPSNSTFEDIDGDGRIENMGNFAGKAKVIEWWIDQFEAKRATYSFENIEFCGYYWYNESMVNESKNMTKRIADHVRSYGSQMFWIPYFGATGIQDWREYGLDVACLQPNYAFHLDVPDSRVVTAANLAKCYGMCLEIEMAESCYTDSRYREKYYEYLKQGAKMGYMTEATHMYYMGMYIGHFVTSNNPEVRAVYDNTYLFIKGTLMATPEALEPAEATVSAGMMNIGRAVDNSDGLYELSLVASATHGSVTLNGDGTFTYFPNVGFTGDDEFSFCYKSGMGYSEPCIVKLHVK